MNRLIIIGATSGIGLATAQCYIRKGWRIGIAGRREEELRKLKESAPEQIEYKAIDITSPNAAEQLQELIDKTGGMDVFLLSSGIGSQNRNLDPTIEIDTIRTNAEGFTRMVTTAFNYFKGRQAGHIVVISSIAGTKGLGAAPAYSATKRFQNHYIDTLVQLARIEHLNIKFTDIRPGFVATDLLKNQDYPLLMQADRVAAQIVKAIDKQKRVAVIDFRYKLLVFFWKLIPQWLWERLSIK